VGIEAGVYLIIHAPKFPSMARKLFAGNEVTVIVLYLGTVFGFRSKILNYVTNPGRLLFLSYPESFERQELRSCERVECHIPAIAELSVDQGRQSGIIVDISSGGCKFVMGNGTDLQHHRIEVGQKITLTCEIYGIEGLKTLPGEVRNMSQDAQRVSLGIQFLSSDSEFSDKVEAFVESVKQVLGEP